MTTPDINVETIVSPLSWQGGWREGHLEMLDQRLLPAQELNHTMTTCQEVADGIREMIIRGAPAIGIAAAYGFALGVRQAVERAHDPRLDLPEIIAALSNTRPTAVNLFWALRRMSAVAEEAAALITAGNLNGFASRMFDEAAAIHQEDIANNLAMGRFGAELFPDNARVLTHCNTGGLATGGYGTALGVIRTAHAIGKLKQVFADETRPYLQGARLTCWELLKDNIDTTLITDSMAGYFMQQGMVDLVILGTDRTAANGDVANKIGSYSLAVLCKHHGIPFYVAAPLSTVDLDTPDGDAITIEERSAREVTHVGDTQLAPDGVNVRHPAFDVTPAELVTAIITEKGVARAPYVTSLKTLKS